MKTLIVILLTISIQAQAMTLEQFYSLNNEEKAQLSDTQLRDLVKQKREQAEQPAAAPAPQQPAQAVPVSQVTEGPLFQVGLGPVWIGIPNPF